MSWLTIARMATHPSTLLLWAFGLGIIPAFGVLFAHLILQPRPGLYRRY